MKIMVGQLRDLDEETALFARQLGIDSVQLNTPSIDCSDGYWKLEDLADLTSRCDSFGLELVALENVPADLMYDIKLGTGERDRQLELYCETVRNVGRAGIPFLGFNFMATGVWRTEVAARGRGGATVSEFDLAAAPGGNRAGGPQGRVDGADPVVSEDQLWRNFEVFVQRVLPVAEAAGVRLALHPDDPPVPAIGRTARLFYSVENLVRAWDIAGRSPAFGFDLCLGTVSEMLGGPTAVRDAIRQLAPSNAICYVHLRQVQGTVPRFKECFLGEGNYSAREILGMLHELGFDGYLLDDHVPGIAGDTAWGHRARAHAIGYMQALLSDLPPSHDAPALVGS